MARDGGDRAARVEDALIAALFFVLYLGAFASRIGRERGALYGLDILVSASGGLWVTIRVLRVLFWPKGRGGRLLLLLTDAVVMVLLMGAGILYILATYDHREALPVSTRALAYGAVGLMGVALGCTMFRLVRLFFNRGVARGSPVRSRPHGG